MGGKLAQLEYFEAKLDDKNRLTLPAELQPELNGAVIVTFGFGEYLHLYSPQVWYEQVEPEMHNAIFDEAGADRAAKVRRGKTTLDLDKKQGRVALKKHLLDYAGIKKEIAAVRVGSYWRIEAKV
jgi:MraZ protein